MRPRLFFPARAETRALLLALTLVSGCGSATGAPAAQVPARTAPAAAVGTPAAAADAAATTQSTGSAAPALPASALPSALHFQVVSDQSKALFRVREQLATLQSPTDAVGTTSSVAGQIVLQPDGTIVADASKITVDMNALKTDQTLRDNFIKRTTLGVAQYPTAQFVPRAAVGLPTPLPSTGEVQFKLSGLMTLHGVQKDVTWDVDAKRDGGALTAKATTEFTFGDFGMTPPKAPAVLSVVDNIRLEVDLVAKQG